MMKTLIVLVSLCAVCFAQGPNHHDPRVIIERVKIYRLTQELDLTTEQAQMFFPKLHELEKIEEDFHEQKLEMLDALKMLVIEEGKEDEIITIVDEFEDAQQKKMKQQMSKLHDMWMVLTPVQRAKFLIFEDEFHREIRDMIKDIKEHRHQQP
jgi:Spy/CpxP family protein refolding chaperone